MSEDTCSGPLAIVVGEKLPALSISWEQPDRPENFSGFVVFMGECSLDIPEELWPESEPVCLQCLIRDGDEALGRGLDLAKAHGQVDFDGAAGAWIVPLP